MGRFILKRALGIIPVLFIVATLSFFLIRIAPGGPFDSDKKIPEEIMRNIEAKYGFDKPLWSQYLTYIMRLASGDLGVSFRYADRSVNDLIGETWVVSASVGLAALIYAVCLGVGAGIYAASKPNSMRDYGAMAFSLLGICLPSFVIGPVLVLIFAMLLGWFNVSGIENPKDIVLPAISLGTIYAAYFARLTRGGMVEIIRQDFIRTARSKGLSEFTVMVRHALKGGLLPVVSFSGPAAAGILTGSFVIEKIFNIPGMGRFFVQSALNRDYGLVLGMVVLFAAVLMILNLIVDVVYALLDPRVRYDN